VASGTRSITEHIRDSDFQMQVNKIASNAENRIQRRNTHLRTDYASYNSEDDTPPVLNNEYE